MIQLTSRGPRNRYDSSMVQGTDKRNQVTQYLLFQATLLGSIAEFGMSNTSFARVPRV